MHCGPLVAIQRRKFRLLIGWKTTLKAAASFRLLPPERFPHTLMFRAFQEILRLTKLAASGARLDAGPSLLLEVPRDDPGLSPDQYMDVFLVGREVLADFLASDEKLAATYSADARNRGRHALDVAVRHLVDSEMRAYFQPGGRTAPTASSAQAGSHVSAGRGEPRRLEPWAPVLREA